MWYHVDGDGFVIGAVHNDMSDMDGWKYSEDKFDGKLFDEDNEPLYIFVDGDIISIDDYEAEEDVDAYSITVFLFGLLVGMAIMGLLIYATTPYFKFFI